MRNSRSFKAKTYFSFGIIIFLSVTLLITVLQLFSVLDGYSSYVERVDTLKNHVHRVKDNENKMFLFDKRNPVFIENGESVYASGIEDYQIKMMDEIIELLDHPLTEDYGIENKFTELNDHFQTYTSLIEEVKEKIRKQGFGSEGVSGELNAILEELKAKVKMYNSPYEIIIIEMSDAMYNFNLKETKEASAEILNTLNSLIETESGEGDSTGLVTSFENVHAKFTEFSTLSSEIGFTGSTGIRASLIANADKIITSCEDLETIVREKVESKKDYLYFGFTILGVLQVLVCIFFAYKLTRNLVTKLNAIKDNLNELSSGTFPKRIEVENIDELGTISLSINQLTDRIEYAANYARSIGQGELSEEYKNEFADDAIAKAIMEMQVKLKLNADKDHLRAWRTEGMAKFANILQENKDGVESLCYEVICNLVKYIKGNQGAFYVVEDKSEGIEVLSVKGVYAYEREKFLDVELEKGEGLIGECWKEGETVILTEIPDDYFLITSGLGDSLPKCVIILPLKYNDEILGVIELASFKELSDEEIEFLEGLGTAIAGTLSSTRVSVQTKDLLSNSRIMQEEMRSQEEMMKQNIEEMKATQDTYEDRETAYINEIEKLKKRS